MRKTIPNQMWMPPKNNAPSGRGSIKKENQTKDPNKDIPLSPLEHLRCQKTQKDEAGDKNNKIKREHHQRERKTFKPRMWCD
ncbi:hypothetical protein FKM82_006723 [Ascaphus truei]